VPGFDDLLTLQTHDSAVDRLRHKRATLPERALLDEALAADVRLREQLAEATGRRDALVREERRLEDEATRLRTKATEEDKRMYSGTVSSPRELQAMQADIDQLRRHAAEIEESELEVMEQREAGDAEVAAFEAEAAKLGAEMDRLTAIIAEAEAAIDSELAVELAAREAVVPNLSADVLKLYEEIRAKNRGMGAGRLTGSNCGACHLSLPATEVDRIRHLPDDTLVRCENCGAILVR
jgi:predicted  nucleic acid-binding Zn-ribbon protein